MAVEAYVDDILESSEAIFRSIIRKIIGQSERNAKIEVVRQYATVDTVLFEAIKSVLHDLNREEGFFTRLLYRYFKFEFRRNKKRTQLIILGSELKSQYHTIQEEKKRTDMYRLSLLNSIKNLRELSSALHNKRLFLSTQPQRNKSDALVRKIYAHIDRLSEYELPLEQRSQAMEETQRMYRHLLGEIPPYYELYDNHALSLPSPLKV
ncbi:MAG TPA: hypothetical protein ENK86_01645 [Campylobacterales bacterium]|nr:hypothetical protein [Campylobacterales bacterium]